MIASDKPEQLISSAIDAAYHLAPEGKVVVFDTHSLALVSEQNSEL